KLAESLDLGAATTPNRATTKVEPPRERTYTVRAGDILGAIAQRECGSAAFQDRILALNPGVDADRLKIGQLLRLPPSTTPEQETARPAEPVPSGARQHVVEKDDSLWALSKRYYGHYQGVERIAAANRATLRGSNSLQIGMRLVIPGE
ncbi:MAG TPA: LysM peptidoglycan-binding domain-containing protein, partial [Planctomycetota bacterium]